MRKLYFIVAVLLLIGCVHTLQTPTNNISLREPAQAAYQSPVLQAEPEDLSFEELAKILETQRFSKIEDLLKYLSTNKPEYMSHYSLAFNSRSLHGSSKQFPRAIVYGKTGQFIITFNGHENQAAYEMLEVVQFNATKNTAEFREIEFNEKGQLKQPYKISPIGGPAVDGQAKCLQCHTGGRWIWESYDNWPGLYGGDDDYPITSFTKNGTNSTLGYENPKSVVEDWLAYKDTHSKVGRYKFLNPLRPSTLFKTPEPRPNTDLSLLLQSLNGRRVAQSLKNAGAYPLRFPLLFALNCHSTYVEARRAPQYYSQYANSTAQPSERIAKLMSAIEKRPEKPCNQIKAFAFTR